MTTASCRTSWTGASSLLNDEHVAGLEEALLHGGGTHSIADVFASVDKGTAQLWLDGDAVIVTEINCAPNEKELHFWLAAGPLDEVIALSEKLVGWGRLSGCTVATLTGRRGWTKALKPNGWEPQSVTMARRL